MRRLLRDNAELWIRAAEALTFPFPLRRPSQLPGQHALQKLLGALLLGGGKQHMRRLIL